MENKKVYGQCKMGLGSFAVIWAGASSSMLLFVLGMFILLDGLKDTNTRAI